MGYSAKGGSGYNIRNRRSSFRGHRKKANPKPGDYARVVSTDDSIIKEGSYGVVEGRGRYSGDKRDVDVVFNFYTPFRYSSHVNASGGPVRQVKVNQFSPTGETKIVPEHDLTKDVLEPDMRTRDRKVKVFDLKL